MILMVGITLAYIFCPAEPTHESGTFYLWDEDLKIYIEKGDCNDK